MCQALRVDNSLATHRSAIPFKNLDLSAGHKMSAPGSILARGPRVARPWFRRRSSCWCSCDKQRENHRQLSVAICVLPCGGRKNFWWNYRRPQRCVRKESEQSSPTSSSSKPSSTTRWICDRICASSERVGKKCSFTVTGSEYGAELTRAVVLKVVDIDSQGSIGASKGSINSLVV